MPNEPKDLMGPKPHLEPLYQATRQILTREETRAETDTLFENAKSSRKGHRATVEKLFVQTPGAETMTPALQKESAAKNTLAYFEKVAGQANLTEAQRRYPELLKVSSASGPAPRPSTVTVPKATSKDIKGSTPTKSVLSGGDS